MMEKNAKIYVDGYRGMVGSTIVCELERHGYANSIRRINIDNIILCIFNVFDENTLLIFVYEVIKWS